jgi:hypothetical protein
MYIDALTVTALVVIGIYVALFVMGCILRHCGSTCEHIEDCDDGTRHYKV